MNLKLSSVVGARTAHSYFHKSYSSFNITCHYHLRPAFEPQTRWYVARGTPAMSQSKPDKQKTANLGNKPGDLDSDHDEWKYKAPYKVHNVAEGFKAVYEASCHCGRVTYQLSKDKPSDAKYCHCTACQKLHGKILITSSIIRS